MSLTRRDAPDERTWWWSQAAFHQRDARDRVAALGRMRKWKPRVEAMKRNVEIDIARALRALLEAWR